MARVAVFDYDTLPPALRQLADAYQARDASWDHLRVLAHRPEMYEAYYRFLYPLHTAGVVAPALKELARLKIAELNQCLF
jgi:alkylhydroperoxidase family enzyme